MTKFSLAKWDENLTIQQNAEHIGVCYNHASVIARENHLKFRRKKHSRPFKNESIQSYMDRRIQKALFPTGCYEKKRQNGN